MAISKQTRLEVSETCGDTRDGGEGGTEASHPGTKYTYPFWQTSLPNVKSMGLGEASLLKVTEAQLILA